MVETTNRPVIFLAFANDRDDTVGYLRNLPDETRRLREVLQSAEQAGLCELVVRTNSTAADIFKVFQDPKYRNRIAILHYGGHANGYQLLLESADGQAAAADAGGLAGFLAQQQGLQLVFLNGCSTLQQTQGLLDAHVPAVISTSRSIGDQVAVDFSFQFYQGLGGGAGIQKAFDEAEAVMTTTQGSATRALYLDDASKVTDSFDAERLPWQLALREGAEHVAAWNLPNAVDDPLFGLPLLPEQDLPESPFRHLNRFTRADTEVFFGRGHQVRELYDRLTGPRTPPVMLFYGQSGVGKSSILDAGLIPRLEHDHEVRYLRRTEGGLLDTLRLAFLPEAPDLPLDRAWRDKERQLGKPLFVFLDQVEEVYTRPIAELSDELPQLLKVIKAAMFESEHRPRGKLILGFRKEWLAELEAQLVACELPRAKLFLEPLDRRGIIEVVEGPARSARLSAHYGLTVEEGLAEIIADDLLADRDAAIAPTLQILLTKMWSQAIEANYEQPYFSQDLYYDLKHDGILLRDFLNQQIDAFRRRYPEAVDSGLLLDLVALHTTPLGTSDQRTVEQLEVAYSHLGAALPDLLQQCQDLHLLTVATERGQAGLKSTRLAHDTLAPLVRERFDESDKPGQRARRILDNRSVDWATDREGSPLDDTDLAIVERGVGGTRALNQVEQRLLEASRRERSKRLRLQRTLKIAGSIAVALIMALALVAVVARNKAQKSELAARTSLDVARDAVDEMLAKVGSESLKDVPQMEPIRAALMVKAKDLYQQLAAQDADREALHRQRALAHLSLAQIQQMMDEREAARHEYELAVEQFTRLLRRTSAVPQDRLELARTYNKFGVFLGGSALAAEQNDSEQMYARALDQLDLLNDDLQREIECQVERALALNNRGVLRLQMNQPGEAKQDFDAVIELLSPFRNDAPATEALKQRVLTLAFAYNNRGLTFDRETEEVEHSLPDFEEAVAIAEKLSTLWPENRELRLELAKWHNNLSGAHRDSGFYAREDQRDRDAEHHEREAEQHNVEARQRLERLAAAAPYIRYELGQAYLTHVVILGSQGQRDAALATLQKAKAIFAELVELDENNAAYRRGMELVDGYEQRLVEPAGATDSQ